MIYEIASSVLKDIYQNSDFYGVATDIPEERFELPAQKAVGTPATSVETYSLPDEKTGEPQHLWKTLIPINPVDQLTVSLDYFLDDVQRTTLLGEIPFRRGSPHRCPLHFAQYACVVLKREGRELRPYRADIRSLLELPLEFLRSKANEPKLAKYLRERLRLPRVKNVEWVDTSYRSVRADPKDTVQKIEVDGVPYPRIPDEELMAWCADPLRFRGHARHWTTRYRDRTEYKLSQSMAEEVGPARKSETEFSFVVKDGGIASVRRGLEKSVLGIIKTFETKLLGDYEHVRVMALKRGYRTPAFAFEAHAETVEPEEMVSSGGKRPRRISWYMRLHDRKNRAPDFGLVRIEIHPGALPSQGRQDEWSRQDSLVVNAIGRAVLEERLPLSTPDWRWDRLIYPIKICERYLHAVLLPQSTVKHFGQHIPMEPTP